MAKLLNAFLVACVLLFSGSNASEGRVDDAYDQLLARMQLISAESPSELRDKRLYEAYLHAVAPYRDEKVMPALSGRDLYYLQLMAEASLFYSYQSQVAVDAERFYRQSIDSNDFDESASRIFYRSMLLASEWSKAQQVESSLPPSVSVIRVRRRDARDDGREVLSPASPDVFEVTSAQPLRNGVYFVGHRDCAWTRKALTDISAQPFLKAWLDEKTLFLAPRNTILQGVQDPGRLPAFQIVLDPREWPEIDSWNLPTFVFVANGKVVDSFSGWPSQDALKDFRAGISKID